MSLVITVVLIGWFTSALIRSSEAKKQAKREARIREDQKRQREELRQQREDAKEWARQQVEIQREQIRQAKEQERLEAKIEKERQERIEADLKLQTQVNDLYYKYDKAEDEIARFNKVLESLIEEKTEAEEELARVKKALSAEDIKDEIRNKESKNNKNWRDASGYDADALRYMDACAEDIGDTRTPKQRASDRAKLEKKAETLKTKVKKYDAQIFTAEQKIKKAKHDKYAVEIKLREVA